MPNSVTVEEAKARWDEILASAKQGETWVITDDTRHRPLALLRPPDAPDFPPSEVVRVEEAAPLAE